jgi:hypothetical protein
MESISVLLTAIIFGAFMLSIGYNKFGPFVSLILVSLLCPLESWGSFFLAGVRIQPHKLATSLAFLLLIDEILLRNRKIYKVPLIKILMAYIFCGIITLSLTPTFIVSLRTIFAEFYLLIIVPFLVVQYCNSDKKIGFLMLSITIGSFIIGAVNTIVGIMYYSGAGVNFIPKKGFIDLSWGRVMWPFIEPVVLGTYCVLIFLFLLGTYNYLPILRYRKIWLLSSILIFITLIFVQGRSAFLGILSGIFALIIKNLSIIKLKRVIYNFSKVTACIFLLTFFTIMISSLTLKKVTGKLIGRIIQTKYIFHEYDPVSGSGGISAQSNLYNALNTISFIKKKPLLGNGVASRSVAYFESYGYDPAVNPEQARGGSSNSLPLMILYDRGIIGFIILIWLLFSFHRLHKSSERNPMPGTWANAAAQGVPPALFGLLVSLIFFGNHVYLASIWLVFGLFLASTKKYFTK